MSTLDLIAAVGLGLALLLMILQVARSVLWIGWPILWFAAFSAWVLLSPWPLEAVAR